MCSDFNSFLITFVRHGETAGNKAQVIQGQIEGKKTKKKEWFNCDLQFEFNEFYCYAVAWRQDTAKQKENNNFSFFFPLLLSSNKTKTVPLNKKGHRQAELLAERLEKDGIEFDLVYVIVVF